MHKIAAAAMPGRASGKVTSRHVSNGVPPRLSEASSMEGFKPSNTLCSVRMTKDRLIDTIPINTAEVVYRISSGSVVIHSNINQILIRHSWPKAPLHTSAMTHIPPQSTEQRHEGIEG